LLYATLSGEVKAVATLLKAGAEVDLASAYGTNPLMVAVYRNQPQILKLLLDQWPDLEQRDHRGRIAEEIAFKQNRQGLLTRFRLQRKAMAQSRVNRRPPFKVRLITWDDQVCYEASLSRIDVTCQIEPECQLERNQLVLCNERGKPYFADLTQAVQRKWGGKPVALDGTRAETASPLRCQEKDIVLMGVR
jgi:ankyrin repeat protein